MKIGIVAGLRREVKFFKDHKNHLIINGYSNESTKVTKELLKKKIDLIVSFGFAASLCKSAKTGDIVIPKKIMNASGLSYNANSMYSGLFKKKIKKKNFYSKLVYEL